MRTPTQCRVSGPLAQSVEQKTFNLLVDGSNPSRPTICSKALSEPHRSARGIHSETPQYSVALQTRRHRCAAMSSQCVYRVFATGGIARCLSRPRHRPDLFVGARQSHDALRYVPDPQRPGSSFHSSLCSCIWKRTGKRSATIQSASWRGLTSLLLGENHTVQRRSSACAATISRDHS